MDFAFFIFMGFLFAGIFYFAHKHEQKVVAEWMGVANEHGLEFFDSQIQGRLPSGRHICIRKEVRGSGKNKQTWTCGSITVDALPVTLVMTRENILHKAGKLFGMQDIQAGDEDFDRKFMIKGEETDVMDGLKHPELRQALEEVMSDSSITIAHQELHKQVHGHLRGDRVHMMITELDRLAERVQSVAPSTDHWW